jgi:hypothetical protein
MRDALGSIYDHPAFEALYLQRGNPAKAPWRLALIPVMQFATDISDRAAADAVRSRSDWKNALRAYRHCKHYCATVPWGMHPRGCGGHWTQPHPRARRLAVRPAGSTQAAGGCCRAGLARGDGPPDCGLPR